MIEFPKYHKINSLFKRDMTKKDKPLIIGDFSQPEFEVLYKAPWFFTEKIDGTNVRILWDGKSFTIGGRTDKAELPQALLSHLNAILDAERFKAEFGDTRVILYGEGFGGKIQAHSRYARRFKEETFACFDIFINGFWLEYEAVSELCAKLEIGCIPAVGEHTPDFVSIAFRFPFMRKSAFGDFDSEGIVGTPKCGLLQRNGKRIIVKIKWRDFK